MPNTYQVLLNRLLLRCLADKGIAFDDMESPPFLAWLNGVNPNYNPAGEHDLLLCGKAERELGADLCVVVQVQCSSGLRTTLLTQEFIAGMENIKKKVAQSTSR